MIPYVLTVFTFKYLDVFPLFYSFFLFDKYSFGISYKCRFRYIQYHSITSMSISHVLFNRFCRMSTHAKCEPPQPIHTKHSHTRSRMRDKAGDRETEWTKWHDRKKECGKERNIKQRKTPNERKTKSSLNRLYRASELHFE